jgi:lipid A 3-O-deacylase
VRALVAIAITVSVLAAPVPRARADDAWTGNIVEEDDFWAPDNRDRHYTHGIRFSATSGDVHEPTWQAPFNWLASGLPIFAGGGPGVVRRYNLSFGQNIYTPENGGLVNPDPRDRPYAGWAYGGLSLMQDTDAEQYEELALKLGLVGPGSLANQVQTKFHLLINVATFRGWHAQLHNEPTLDLFYTRKWRFWQAIGEDRDWGWDAIPEASARVGNVYDYLAGGGMIRLGRNLRVDYGPPHVDLNNGSEYINPDRADVEGIGFYVFLGAEGRAVARNIFLDGNSFKASASVDKLPVVGDLESGLAGTWGHWRLAYTYVYRSQEFIHQNAPDHYGSLNLTFRASF